MKTALNEIGTVISREFNEMLTIFQDWWNLPHTIFEAIMFIAFLYVGFHVLIYGILLSWADIPEDTEDAQE